MPIPIVNRKFLYTSLAVAGLLALACSDVVQGEASRQAQPSNSQKPAGDAAAQSHKTKENPPELPPIDKMLIMAIENNPDILVAKSKVSQAESELNRTRLQVTRQILTLREAVQNQREKVIGMRGLVEAGGPIGTKEFGDELTKLAAIEAELQYTLGQSPSGGTAGK